MNTEHIDVGADFSDAQVAEIFLHHRVLLVPVVDGRQVVGVITRIGLLPLGGGAVLESVASRRLGGYAPVDLR